MSTSNGQDGQHNGQYHGRHNTNSGRKQSIFRKKVSRASFRKVKHGKSARNGDGLILEDNDVPGDAESILLSFPFPTIFLSLKKMKVDFILFSDKFLIVSRQNLLL